ncbi:hypothetical protein EDC01DRAFT_755375 [Geopyxis carbonaria]|nr:hypothetical protein EDC01DRAFT_755375 [Geopyxis carbonaria]
MHPRNPYKTYVDFRELAKDYPDLYDLFLCGKYVAINDYQISDQDSELAKSLLNRDFGLMVDLPENRLCPMVPNRVNYVLWIQDLLDSTGHSPYSSYDPSSPVTGLDIGTGASCIYPLVACALRNSWKMVGTEIDSLSVISATQNVQRNIERLGDRIRICEVKPDGPCIPLDALANSGSIDFIMCNPPFYSSVNEMLHSAEVKSLPPLSACTGAIFEMVYEPHGELGFARRILAESLELRDRITWYTILFGKLSSVGALIKDLKNVDGIKGNWAITELLQGSTKRWAVAWSFNNRRPAQAVSVSEAPALRGCSPFPPEFSIRTGCNDQENYEKVKALVASMDTEKYFWKDDLKIIIGEVRGNVWSRAYRRAVQNGKITAGLGLPLGFFIRVSDGIVLIRWTMGCDSVLFESFCGMVKRSIVYKQ